MQRWHKDQRAEIPTKVKACPVCVCDYLWWWRKPCLGESVLQTGWLKTPEIYSSTVLEARSKKSRICKALLSLQPVWENPFWPLPSFWWGQSILGIPWLAAASYQSLSLSSHGPLPVSLSPHGVLFPMFLSSSCEDISDVGLKTHLSISAKILFPIKGTFTDTGG